MFQAIQKFVIERPVPEDPESEHQCLDIEVLLH